ncbi:MAG: outer membrane lipoprotein LolB [Pseudomonadales bacterium]|nr:outer membrane lipoprotein LolB [Pseudomonadales bacterium]MBO6704244.1 outer membrane lipoprotein LolB [Pseudomonadales bacterium]MBO7007571.1 outer membrane lipoprotein LolB [Pseudomonadales bacterium]
MRFLVILLIFFVAGCVTVKDIPPPSERLWQMKGKLSVSFGGQTRVLSMEWRQSGDTSAITLQGPFGSGEANLSVSEENIWLDTGEGPRRFGPDQLIQLDDRSLDLPWRRLSYWVRGKTGPSGERFSGELEYGQWRIRVIRENAEGPELMAFEHPEIALRLRVQSLTGNI